ncbi:hypothetical protein O181_067222 [Austropuccinia psidii MF-1]|uniref:Uncharacterized protein n=1 Tax=Austropuccinia psidii MF-1 TaxID=1389203 RepID=A0A9Q3F0C3_9BASI|nr:hypothetical protein [Austropuccinia psidii MF-1]
MICMAGDEFYSSSPLVHKQRVIGHHNLCTSNTRMGHARTSREKGVDDEDEKKSPTQSEMNGKPRRALREAVSSSTLKCPLIRDKIVNEPVFQSPQHGKTFKPK